MAVSQGQAWENGGLRFFLFHDVQQRLLVVHDDDNNNNNIPADDEYTMSYSHRTLPPQGPPGPPPAAGPGAHNPARLAESIDIVRQEFDVLTRDLEHLRGQRDEFEGRSRHHYVHLYRLC